MHDITKHTHFVMFLYHFRCQCNGHATHCVEVPDDEVPDDEQRISKTKMKCICQHGTDGPNCEYCLADHWDRPWKRATTENANECLRKFLQVVTLVRSVPVVALLLLLYSVHIGAHHYDGHVVGVRPQRRYIPMSVSPELLVCAQRNVE